MLGSNVLDVAIGLVLVFLLLSLAATAVREAVAAIYRTRARFLLTGIEDLLQNDRALLDAFYQHPQIFALYQGKTVDLKNHPSYIPSRNFSMALLDMAVRGVNTRSAVGATAESTPLTADNVRRYVSGLGNPQVQRMILGALDSAHDDLAQARKEIEAWFDSAMDRVSGRYKRRTTWVLFVIGGAMTILLNVDTIRVGTSFYKSPALRDAAVAMAAHITDSVRTPATPPATVSPPAGAAPTQTPTSRTAIPVDPRSALDSLYALRLPIGWSDVVSGNWPAGNEWGGVWRRTVASLFGWLLTAFAVSLGAPFWFDALNKIMVIRSTVKPREKSQEEGSEDRKSKSSDTGPAAGGAAVTKEVSTPTIVINPPPPAPVVAAGGVGSPGVAHEWSVGDPEGGII